MKDTDEGKAKEIYKSNGIFDHMHTLLTMKDRLKRSFDLDIER